MTTFTRYARCPHCDADLNGDEIPENIREHYRPPYRWRREVAIYCRERDRVTAYECPDCKKQWSASPALKETGQ